MNRPSGEELLRQLKEWNEQVKTARLQIADLKKRLVASESLLIEATINRDRVVEKLRMLRNETVNEEMSDREHDIARFKELLPELLKKV